MFQEEIYKANVEGFLLYYNSDLRKAEDSLKRSFTSSKKHTLEEMVEEAVEKVKLKYGTDITILAKERLIARGWFK